MESKIITNIRLHAARVYMLAACFLFSFNLLAQVNHKTVLVNPFLGSSGDHGQLSPAASYPFSMLSIGAHTYPTTHTGYEFYAKKFYGFTHNRFEGVGCQGSGGVLLIKPLKSDKEMDIAFPLDKLSDQASPGRYQVKFQNGVAASMAVWKNSGIHHYEFQDEKKNRGIFIDLRHSFNRAFVSEVHKIKGQTMTGIIRSKTTCHAGVYTIYFALHLDKPVDWQVLENGQYKVMTKTAEKDLVVRIGFSSVSETDAEHNLRHESFSQLAEKSRADWDKLLNKIEVKGEKNRVELFYSLLYRGLQSPYLISDNSGKYRAIDGSLQQSETDLYHGWAIWDNYKTQLPLLGLIYPEIYQPIVHSIANLYPYGKKDFATQNEPANSVRTEHAIVVLLDAFRKGYKVDFHAILDSLRSEVDQLTSKSPDKALETAYDYWAIGHIYKSIGQDDLAQNYLNKASEYQSRWKDEFADLRRSDVDRMSARSMYQGTIRQYRWSVPFDNKGLKELIGGEEKYVQELDDFFDNDYFNRANEPDLHVPAMYQSSQQPWKSQFWIHKLAVDTVINHYFNDNSRGIGAEIDVIFKNQPKAFIRTMDDDAGAMSGWFCWAGIGLYPAAVGHPVYYIHLPLFEEVNLHINTEKTFQIRVKNYGLHKKYIEKAIFNGKPLDRNWLTHEEIIRGGELTLYADTKPNKNFGVNNQWESKLDK